MNLSSELHKGSRETGKRSLRMKFNAFAAVSALAVASAALAACGSQTGATRDQVRVVGSSTVLPFAKAVS